MSERPRSWCCSSRSYFCRIDKTVNEYFFKRNANVLSFNAIADVRRHFRRRHEIILNMAISETTTGADSFKIYHDVALDGLYISTGNYVTICFKTAACRTTCSFWVMFESRFLDSSRPTPLLSCNPVDLIAPRLRKRGLKSTYTYIPSSTHDIND